MEDTVNVDVASTLPIASEKVSLPTIMVDARNVIDDIMGVEMRPANTLEMESNTVLNELSVIFVPISVENVPLIVLNSYTFAEDTISDGAIMVEKIP